MEKLSLTKQDATVFAPTGAEFNVAFTASTAGIKTLTGEVKYALMTTNQAYPQTEKISIKVDVK